MTSQRLVDFRLGVDCIFDHLIGHCSLLGGISSSPLLGAVGGRFHNIRYRTFFKRGTDDGESQ